MNLFGKGVAGLLIRRKTWLTRDNRKIKVRDMEDSHLVRTLLMLKRNANAYIYIQGLRMCQAASMFSGEMAIDSIEREMERFAQSQWSDMYEPEALDVLLDEAKRRGLEWESDTAYLWV